MSISDSIEGNIDADIGFDVLEVIVLGLDVLEAFASRYDGGLDYTYDTIGRMVLCCK